MAAREMTHSILGVELGAQLQSAILAGADELQVIAGLSAGPQRRTPDVPAARVLLTRCSAICVA